MSNRNEVDFVRTLAPAPDWLQEIQQEAKRRGLDKLTMSEIDAAITAVRQERRERNQQNGAGQV